MSRIKFVATDMDGTLLNSKKEINEEFYEVFEEMRERDIIFAAASGRQYYSLLEVFDDIKDDMMFIAENGTFVVYKGKELFTNLLDRELSMELIKVGREIEESYVVLCGKEAAYIENDSPRLVDEVAKYYKRYKIVDDLTKVDDDILKISICDFKGAEENSSKYYEKYRDKAQVAVSIDRWLDIMAKNVNKGEAIKRVQELLGISYDETMVFGDYLNDLEMMSSGYYSYAMENAHDDLKKVARFRAKSNDENGVVEVLKEHIKQLEVVSFV